MRTKDPDIGTRAQVLLYLTATTKRKLGGKQVYLGIGTMLKPRKAKIGIRNSPVSWMMSLQKTRKMFIFAVHNAAAY